MNTSETQLRHFRPDELDEGVLYVSVEYDTTIHLCAWGCRNQVVLGHNQVVLGHGVRADGG